jgi:hypothetical protein
MAKMMRSMSSKYFREEYMDSNGEINLPNSDPYYLEMVKKT